MNKEKIAFIVDSSIGIFGQEIKFDNVRQVFFNIQDSKNNEYLDNNIDLNIESIISKFKDDETFKTSAVSPGHVMAAAEELFEKYEKIILITLSSGLSSFHDNIKFLEEEYKDKFFVVDSKELGAAYKDTFFKAKQMADDGKTVKEIIEFCENQYKNNFTAFTCESWEPLSKSGRAPKLLAKTLSTLHTRPVLNFYIKNRLAGIVLGKGEKGFMKSVEKMIENFKKTFSQNSTNDIDYVVFYNNKLENSKAEIVRKKIVELLNVTKEKIIETFTPSLVFVYTGIGSFGIHIKSKKEAVNRE